MITCSGSTGDTALALPLYFSMSGIFGSLFSALCENLGIFDYVAMKSIGPFLRRALYFNTPYSIFIILVVWLTFQFCFLKDVLQKVSPLELL